MRYLIIKKIILIVILITETNYISCIDTQSINADEVIPRYRVLIENLKDKLIQRRAAHERVPCLRLNEPLQAIEYALEELELISMKFCPAAVTTPRPVGAPVTKASKKRQGHVRRQMYGPVYSYLYKELQYPAKYSHQIGSQLHNSNYNDPYQENLLQHLPLQSQYIYQHHHNPLLHQTNYYNQKLPAQQQSTNFEKYPWHHYSNEYYQQKPMDDNYIEPQLNINDWNNIYFQQIYPSLDKLYQQVREPIDFTEMSVNNNNNNSEEYITFDKDVEELERTKGQQEMRRKGPCRRRSSNQVSPSLKLEKTSLPEETATAEFRGNNRGKVREYQKESSKRSSSSNVVNVTKKSNTENLQRKIQAIPTILYRDHLQPNQQFAIDIDGMGSIMKFLETKEKDKVKLSNSTKNDEVSSIKKETRSAVGDKNENCCMEQKASKIAARMMNERRNSGNDTDDIPSFILDPMITLS